MFKISSQQTFNSFILIFYTFSCVHSMKQCPRVGQCSYGGCRVEEFSGSRFSHEFHKQARRFTTWPLLATRRQPSRPLKFTDCTLAVSTVTCWKNFVFVFTSLVLTFLHGAITVNKYDKDSINNLAGNNKEVVWNIDSFPLDFWVYQQSFRLFGFSPACWLEF